MSNLTPLLSKLGTLIDEIEVEMGKGNFTQDEKNILLNLINRGLPVIGIEPSAQQWVNLIYGYPTDQNNQ